MILKNLMEEKQLDLNQPLLSVRKFAPAAAASTAEAQNKRKPDNTVPRLPPLPAYKSELKSGPVRNPGTVPFVWEQTPGRPKDESKPQRRPLEWHPVAPKLPPGRALNAKEQASDQQSKEKAGSQCQLRNDISGYQNAHSSTRKDILTVQDSTRQVREEAGSSSSDGCDEVYVDALDTLSRSGSFSLNCSVNGVIGLDGPDMESSRTFSSDPCTRDFMMGRFLPAAKAMASETPQCHTRKQPVPREEPFPRKMVPRKRNPAVNQSRSNDIPYYAQVHGVGEISDDEDNDDDCEGSYHSSNKVCGLFPRLCLQNSFCLLNPVPAMRKQAPISSVRTIRAKPSNAAPPTRAGSCIEAENEHDGDAVYKPRSMDRLQVTLIHEDKKDLKSESKMTISKTDCHTLDGSSMYKSLEDKGSLPSHHQISHSSVKEEKGPFGIPENVSVPNPRAKGCSSFGELLATDRNEQDSGFASPAVEKTVYIDSVQSSGPDVKDLVDYTRDDVKMFVKQRETDEAAAMDSSVQDINHLNAAEKKAKLRQASCDSASSLSGRSIEDVKSEGMDGFSIDKYLADKEGNFGMGNQRDGKYGTLERSHRLMQDSITTTAGKLGHGGKNDVQNQHFTKLRHKETNGCHSLSPLPPPLPKSPSESWLKRTLPSVSSRNSSSRSSLGRVYPGVQASKTQSSDPKWETIVRISNVQHGHLRFSSEELLPPIPET